MQESEKPKTALYDADAEQRVPMRVEKRGRMYNVAHIFQAITDEDVLEYERLRDVRLSEADPSEIDDPQATAISENSFDAAVRLWERRIVRVEGYADHPQWKEKLTPNDMVFAVQQGLLAVSVAPLDNASDGEVAPIVDDDSSVIRLSVLFDGHEVMTEHIINAPTAEQARQYRDLMGRSYTVRGTRRGMDQRIPSKAKALGKLYDAMMFEASGYVGRVPLHHKMAVVLHHLRAQLQVVEGN